MKKYKIKKRKNIIRPYYFFFIFIILILILSTGYALFSEDLMITGSITFSNSNQYEEGFSTYSYKTLNIWANSYGGKTYQIEIILNNLDEDVDPWELSFDLPDGFIETSNIWQASSVSLSGNTVTLKANSWNSYIANNSTYTFNFILDFDREVEFSLSNLILNGFLVKHSPIE